MYFKSFTILLLGGELLSLKTAPVYIIISL